MRITYHAPAGDNQEIDYFGHKLKDGEGVNIDRLDADDVRNRMLIRKAMSNPTLEVSGVDDATSGKDIEGADELDKEALLDEADRRGVEVDKRWGAARIKEALDKARK